MSELEDPRTLDADEEAALAEQRNGDTDDTANLLGQLRTIHQGIKEGDFFKDVDVPGYQKLIWMRFRPYSVSKGGKRVKAMRKRFEEDDPEVVLDAACDTIIDATEQMMLLPTKFAGNPGKKGENLKPLDDEIPIRFDSRLNDALQLGLSPAGRGPSARQVVKELFPTEQAIIGVASDLSDWLRDVTKDVNEEFLGE